MKTFFEEPVIRVEKFAAESVMDGTFEIISGIFNAEDDRTAGIFARPY